MRNIKNQQNSQQLSKEELTRTQVLNLSVLEKVARYEKKTSKKPAIILAVIGAFLILSGFTSMAVINFMNSEPIKESSTVYRKETPVEEKEEKVITCIYKQLAHTDGTDSFVIMNLYLKNNALTKYEKTMTVTPTVGYESVGLPTIQHLLPAYQTFEELEIPGYIIKSLPEANGFKTSVAIDLTILDVNLLNVYHHSNVSTKVEFALGATEEEILATAQVLGYTCQ